MKKIIKILLSITLALSFLSSSGLSNHVNAASGNTTEFAGGSGTANDPYLISKVEHLDNVRYYLNAHFKMINDIDLTDAISTNGEFSYGGRGWNPIGSKNYYNADAFTGVFDGNKHVIKGMNIKVSNFYEKIYNMYLGLFASNAGTIKNLMVIGSISASPAYSMTIRAGGIAGQNSGTIMNCASDVDVSIGQEVMLSEDNGDYAGGIAGTNTGLIDSSYNSGDIKCYDYASTPHAGGISGSGGTITNSYNTGNITSKQSRVGNYVTYAYAGGITGYASTSSNIQYCYNVGVVSASGGGSASYKYAIAINGASDCYYLEGTGASKTGSISLSENQMKKKGTFKNFDFNNTWTMEGKSDYSYPELQSFALSGNLKIKGNVSYLETISPDLSEIKSVDNTFRYEWLVDGVVVAYTKTYTIKATDIGKNIQLKLIGTKEFNQGTLYSDEITVSKAVQTANPVVPDKVMVNDNKLEITTVSNQEYSLDNVNWQSNGIFENLEPNKQYTVYTRIVEDDLYLAGETKAVLTITTDCRQLTGTVDIIGYPIYGETLTADISKIGPDNGATYKYEWKRDDKVVGTDKSYSIVKEDLYKMLTLYVIGTDGYVGTLVSMSVYPSQVRVPKPSAPVVEYKTHNTIKLVANYNYEYSMDKIYWQDSSSFENLSPNTKYTFYQRIKETETSFRSEISDGLEAYTYKICEVDPSFHIYDNDCDESCNECGKTREVTHDYTQIETVKATLTKNGYILTTCSRCGNEKSRSIIYFVETITLLETSYIYDGNNKTPDIIIKDANGNELVKDIDYDVIYTNNLNAGTANATITFKGNYEGTTSKTYEIIKVNESDITVELDYEEVEYTGDEIKLSYEVYDCYGNILVEERDYEVTYKDNIEVGTATIIITYKGNYDGVTEKNFEILKPRIEITSVKLNESIVVIDKDDSIQLEATIYPSDTTDSKELTWQSDNENIATVDQDGKVTAIGSGATTITVTTENGKTATCIVVVNVESKVLEYVPQEVTLDMLEDYFNGCSLLVRDLAPGTVVNDRTVFHYLIFYTNYLNDYFTGYYAYVPYSVFMQYADAYFYNHSDFKSDVDEYQYYDEENDLIVFGLGGFGSASEFTWLGTERHGDFYKIYIKEHDYSIEADSYYLLTLVCTEDNGLKIYGMQEINSYIIENPYHIVEEEKHYDNGKSYYQVNVDTNHSTVNIKNLVELDNIDGKWLEEDNKLEFDVTCEEGYRITSVMVNGKDLGNKDSYEIEHPLKPITIKVITEKYIPVTSVTLNKNNVEVKEGETFDLIATINPSNATDKNLTWTSSDESIVSVDQNGKVTAIKAGTATVTVTASNGLTATCSVTVLKPITSITLNVTDITLVVGEQYQFIATINPSDTTDSKYLRWNCNNAGFYVDENGKFSSSHEGTGTVTVTTVNGLTATCTVTVIRPITSVTLNKNYAELEIGNTLSLYPTIEPYDTTDSKEVTWTSSDESVASVDQNGKVTAIKVGTATITVETVNGKTDTCTIKVIKPIISVLLDRMNVKLAKGDSLQLNATIYPFDTTDSKELTWTSGNSKVATVDQNGKVTAVGAGITYITVTTSNGLSYTCTVEVNIPITSIIIDHTNVSLPVGQSTTLTANVFPVETTDSKVITWRSSNPSIVYVDDNGAVTGITPGTALITATTVNGYSDSIEVTVLSKVEQITLDKTSATITKDNTLQLNASIYPTNVTGDKTLHWRSDNENIATVDQDGKVTAIGIGTTTISVFNSGGAFATCTITVVDNSKPITSITLNTYETTIQNGNSYQLIATVNPSDTTDSKNVTWFSSNEFIASVDSSGKVFAYNEGSVVITAMAGRNGITASCIITVKNHLNALDKIELNKTNIEMRKGESQTLSVTYYHNFEEFDYTLTWTSSNPNVVTVDGNGKVTAKNAGAATITVKSAYGHVDTCSITVKDPSKPELTGVDRIFGSTRYQTAMEVANALKEELGVSKFETVIIATGIDYPDALAGSYLAGKKNAPILMVNERYMDDVANYVRNNVVAGGKVYILGGEKAVSPVLETKLSGYNIERLAGANRFETNLLILEEAKVTNEDILICTGYDFADSLSASATERPILLVHPKSGLNAKQIEFLNNVRGNKMYVIGGVNAVNDNIFNTVKSYAGSIKRIGGSDRNETSVLIAKEFFNAPTSAVVAYSRGFADGLVGGPLAIAKKAPLILTQPNKTSYARDYIRSNNIKSGNVLGGTILLSDENVIDIFNLK